MEAFGSLELAQMQTALPGAPDPCCELCRVAWARLKGSVGLGLGQVVPGGAEFDVWDTVAVGGYSPLLKPSSERNHVDLVSLAETSVSEIKRESLGDA